MPSPKELLDELTKIKKELGKELRFGNDPTLEIEFLSTGIPSLDSILGGGLRRGQQILVYGESSTGKTYLSQMVIKAAQERGFSTCFVDVERTFTPDWFTTSGVNVDDLIVSRPRTAEETIDTVKALVRAKCDVIIVDSLAAMAPGQELEKDAEGNTMALQAKFVGRMCREVNAENDKSVVIYLNQIRSSMNPYGPSETLPGGKAQHFFAWQKIKVKKGDVLSASDLGIDKSDLKKSEDAAKMGFEMVFLVEKNKQGAPWQVAKVPFSYRSGLNLLAALIDIALEKEIIEQRGGGFFYYEGENIARGRAALIKFIEENPELQELILAS